jgi:hypothetical protein
MPEATFSIFLFHSPHFSPLYRECKLSPPLRNYKRRGKGRLYGREEVIEKRTTRVHPHRNYTSCTTTHKRHGTCSLSRKLVTPTTSIPVQGNMNRSETH